MTEHESGLVKFVAEPQRRRLSTLLELGAKRRPDVRALLDHQIQLDPRFAQVIPRHEHSPEKVTARLRSLGAPPVCWLLSVDTDLDGRELVLDEGVARLIQSMSGGFVSCRPGKLAYFQFETPGPAFLLVR